MRLAQNTDIPALTNLYNEATEYATAVGHIDWPSPFPSNFFKPLIDRQEVLCANDELGLVAAVRLTTDGDQRIWSDQDPGNGFLYISKLAVTTRMHNKDYVRSELLPAGIDMAKSLNLDGLRGDCLADNPRLSAFYASLGFASLGDVSFYSKIQHKQIAVTRLELALQS